MSSMSVKLNASGKTLADLGKTMAARKTFPPSSTKSLPAMANGLTNT